MWIVVGDTPNDDISIFFASTFNFIEENIKNGNVLVHCQAGISRSTCIVVAYLIRKHNLSYSEAFLKVK